MTVFVKFTKTNCISGKTEIVDIEEFTQELYILCNN